MIYNQKLWGIIFAGTNLGASELVYPDKVEYEISFILDKKLRFAPYNLSIRIENVDKELELSQLNEDRKFVLKVYGSELRAGENMFKILVKYKDKNEKSYETSEEFNISLVDVSIFQRIVIFFRQVFS